MVLKQIVLRQKRRSTHVLHTNSSALLRMRTSLSSLALIGLRHAAKHILDISRHFVHHVTPVPSSEQIVLRWKTQSTNESCAGEADTRPVAALPGPVVPGMTLRQLPEGEDSSHIDLEASENHQRVRELSDLPP